MTDIRSEGGLAVLRNTPGVVRGYWYGLSKNDHELIGCLTVLIGCPLATVVGAMESLNAPEPVFLYRWVLTVLAVVIVAYFGYRASKSESEEGAE